jgi:RNA polymerase sigma-70 factor, ECF subfamily
MDMGLNEQLRGFYETYRQELFAYALSITGCPAAAEDAVHTAFSRALEAGRTPREWRPYLFRCVRNAALDVLRTAQREMQKWRLYAECAASDPPELHQRQEEVEQALAGLPDNERECIVLKVYSGLTFQEIARVRGVPQGTAASWYWRGLAKLRAGLEESS